ncbi:MAG: helix-hairpin-helix domain-containing protein [Verrucomicrobia bacterium]|jgi:competence protein ComEA|nr:helix-hairpin-helix domain-containing protein [Verrucomicrobiota bacterium]MDA1203142.1 helix-hairpin-helix domain-containing protein [Verrucomicrobiota bacterium]
MKRLVAFLFIGIASAAIGQELQKFENCSLVEAGWADGDSFPVKLPDGREIILRLYYVDCNETSATSETDQRRVRGQSSYFGIDDHQVTLASGRRAAEELRKMLAKPFTVHTAFAAAPGRSAKPRTYGFVTLSDGRDLGAVLVGEGLARSFGLRRGTPDGLTTDAAEARMDDLELGAAIARRGIWAETDAQRLISLREAQRAEERELQEAFGPRAGEPIDPNTASVDEIMLLPGIGEVLAERIVKGRPYKTIDDLRRVPGVGDKVFAKLRDSLQIAP